MEFDEDPWSKSWEGQRIPPTGGGALLSIRKNDYTPVVERKITFSQEAHRR
jgi:hypothetical protein